MAIEGYVGRPGSGKSYTLTERVLEEADKGRICFTPCKQFGCGEFAGSEAWEPLIVGDAIRVAGRPADDVARTHRVSWGSHRLDVEP